MNDLDAFERRFVGRLRDYADAMPVAVDPVAVADRVATERGARWSDLLGPFLGGHRRLVWLGVALLLAAMAGSILMAGSRLVSLVPDPLAEPDFDVTLVAPGTHAAAAVADGNGDVWALTLDRVVRLRGVDRHVDTWDIGDGPAFAALGIAASRTDGVWLIGQRQLWHFDGTSLGDPIATPVEGALLASVAEGPEGVLWVGTEPGAIWKGEGGHWVKVTPDESVAVAISLAVDTAGDAWAVEVTYPGPVPVGLTRYRGAGEAASLAMSDGGALPAIEVVVADPSGGVRAGSPSGMLRCKGDVCEATALPRSGVSGGLWVPAIGADGTAWGVLSWADGVRRIVREGGDGEFEDVTTVGLPELADGSVGTTALVMTGDGTLASTEAGVYRLTGDQWERAWPVRSVTVAPLLDLAAVDGDEAWGVSVHAWNDDVADIWHADAAGLAQRKIGIPNTTVRDITVAPDGIVWAATSRGIAILADGAARIVDAQAASAISVSAGGSIWAADAASAWQLTRTDSGYSRSTTVELPRFGGGRAITPALAVDVAGHPWISGGRGAWIDAPGLYRLVGKDWQFMEPVEHAERIVFSSIAAGPDGAVWVTFNGIGTSRSCCDLPDPATEVARFDHGRWSVYGTADGLPSDNVEMCVAVGPDGAAWLSTTSGLYRFDGDRWSLAYGGHFFGRLTVASDGTLWTSAESGIVRLTPKTP